MSMTEVFWLGFYIFADVSVICVYNLITQVLFLKRNLVVLENK
jgi:hypothetical protein